MKTLAHRWPTAVGALAAVGMILAGPNRIAVALVVAIATTCYVAAAVFARPWMAWAWIPIAFVVVVAGKLVDVEPMVATGVGRRRARRGRPGPTRHPTRRDARDRGPAGLRRVHRRRAVARALPSASSWSR